MSTPSDDDFDNDALQEGLGRALAGVPPSSQPSLPGLGSTLAGSNAADPPNSYIDVYTYKGLDSNWFGHTGISVNGGRAYGLEPIPGEDAASVLGTVRGYVQPIPRQRQPIGHVHIPVTADQAEAVRQYILANPAGHSYSLGGPNCVGFVQGALDEAGVKNPINYFGMTTPNELLMGLGLAQTPSQP